MSQIDVGSPDVEQGCAMGLILAHVRWVAYAFRCITLELVPFVIGAALNARAVQCGYSHSQLRKTTAGLSLGNCYV